MTTGDSKEIHWRWLCPGSNSDHCVVEAVKHFQNPLAFWRKIQTHLRAWGDAGNEDPIDQLCDWLSVPRGDLETSEGMNDVAGRIKGWMNAIENDRAIPHEGGLGFIALDEWKSSYNNKWLSSATSCSNAALFKLWKDGDIPRMGPFPEGKKDLSESEALKIRFELALSAGRFITSVLLLFPRVFRDYVRSKQEDGDQSQGASGQISGAAKASQGGIVWQFVNNLTNGASKTVQFPVAAVTGDSGSIVRVNVEIRRPGQGVVIPHPLLGLADLTVDENFIRAAESALQAAQNACAPESVEIVNAAFFSEDFLASRTVSLEGASAGGAFALAFGRILAGKPYDQRVLVITQVKEDGTLGPVDDGSSGGSLTFLERKARGVLLHNKNLEIDDPTRIDTIVVVELQREAMEKALAKAGRDLNLETVASDIRVVSVESLPD